MQRACEHIKKTGEKEVFLDHSNCYFHLLWYMGDCIFCQTRKSWCGLHAKIRNDKKQTIIASKLVLHIPSWMNEFLVFMKSLLCIKKTSVKFDV